ncbi:MAG: ACP S-malonyltransferase [Cyanobacteria bacterium SIG30]|nr:ACP S-malonyltransferase [Cyanobacteria bacterium SIG30]
MAKYAFIFPGQGAQKAGMGLDFYENFEVSKNVFEVANKVLNKNVSKICFEGTDEELKQTVNTQSAILAVEIAILEAFKSKTSIRPSFVAGHSLGEYAALYESGAIDLENIFKAIQKRAELMHSATLIGEKGSMAAVLGLDKEIIKENLIDGVSIANYNEPAQTVITGKEDIILKMVDILKAKGARKVIPLAVSGAFHSPLMQSASDNFKNFIDEIIVNDAKIPVVTNVDAMCTTDKDELKEKMPKQISNSVFWVQTIERMLNEGVDTFIEIGPGKVLSGLNKKMCPENVKTYNIFDIQSLNDTLNELN